MTVDTEKLRALAQAATQGWDGAQIGVGHNPHHAELIGDYIATAQPSTMLALLEENARLYRALKRWQFVDCPQCGGDCEGAGVADCIMQETRTALSGGDMRDTALGRSR